MSYAKPKAKRWCPSQDRSASNNNANKYNWFLLLISGISKSLIDWSPPRATLLMNCLLSARRIMWSHSSFDRKFGISKKKKMVLRTVVRKNKTLISFMVLISARKLKATQGKSRSRVFWYVVNLTKQKRPHCSCYALFDSISKIYLLDVTNLQQSIVQNMTFPISNTNCESYVWVLRWKMNHGYKVFLPLSIFLAHFRIWQFNRSHELCIPIRCRFTRRLLQEIIQVRFFTKI